MARTPDIHFRSTELAPMIHAYVDCVSRAADRGAQTRILRELVEIGLRQKLKALPAKSAEKVLQARGPADRREGRPRAA